MVPRRTMKLFYLVIPVLLFACFDDSSYYLNGLNGPSTNQIIKFDSISESIVPSDGHSKYFIKVSIYPQFDASMYTTITFKTNLGHFSNDNKEIDINLNSRGIAQTELISSNEPGNGILSASVSNYLIDTLIEFIPAYPNDFIFSSSKTRVDITENLQFEVKLFRDSGITNDKIKIKFDSKGIDNPLDVLVIDPFVYSNDQVATAELKNPDSHIGKFRIYATVPITNNDIDISEKIDSIDIVIQ